MFEEFNITPEEITAEETQQDYYMNELLEREEVN